jgi:cystathionine beta-lyase
MDFPPPTEAVEKVTQSLALGDTGYYSDLPKQLYIESYSKWATQRFDSAPADFLFSQDVVSAIHWVINALIPKKAAIATFVPAYPPFFELIIKNGHNLIEVPIGNDGTVDYDRMAEIFKKENPEAFLLCNPHNPTGKVFNRHELTLIGEICARHHTRVLSDEIHQDLLIDAVKHIPFRSIDSEAASGSVIFVSASKTFNLAGLKAAHIETQDGQVSSLLNRVPEHFRSSATGVGLIAASAAYASGSAWLDTTLETIRGNVEMLLEILSGFPNVTVFKPQGTYLVWGEIRGLPDGMTAAGFLLERARVAASAGETFDPRASSWFRLNLATYPEVSQEIGTRIRRALDEIG